MGHLLSKHDLWHGTLDTFAVGRFRCGHVRRSGIAKWCVTAALKAAAAQAGAVASSLQQQLQQRLLSGQTGFVHQKPLLETQSAAAAAAIAARNHVGGQLNGPGMNINFSQQRSVFVPSPSGAAGHGSEPGWTGRAGNEGDANAKKRSRDGMGTTASKPHPTS